MTDLQTSDRDVSRAIRSWLHEDRHEDASRVSGTVLDRVETTPQRRAGWPAWRTPTMNRFLTFGFGAAVVLIAMLLGWRALGLPTNVGDRSARQQPRPCHRPGQQPPLQRLPVRPVRTCPKARTCSGVRTSA